EYQSARHTTLVFLARRSNLEAYFPAIQHWEYFLSASWHALEAHILLFTGDRRRVFDAGDGSAKERLNQLYNDAKHAERLIERDDTPTIGPLPVWLSNEGLQSTNALLTYPEAASVLSALLDWSWVLQSPADSAERHREWREREDADAEPD